MGQGIYSLEHRLMRLALRWYSRGGRWRARGWPNGGHPAQHVYWRRLVWPWSETGMCWFCGLSYSRGRRRRSSGGRGAL